MSGSEVSGIDLARVALRAAMEAARADGGGQKAKVRLRIVRTVRRDGREPMGLGAAIGALVTERAWELPAAGATLRDRWAAIAPELAGHVAAPIVIWPFPDDCEKDCRDILAKKQNTWFGMRSYGGGERKRTRFSPSWTSTSTPSSRAV